MKELGSEVAGHGEDTQQTQPKTTNPIVRTGRLVSTEQLSSSSAQEIHKRVSLDCDSTNRTGRLVSSCVPVSVERFEKTKTQRRDPLDVNNPSICSHNVMK